MRNTIAVFILGSVVIGLLIAGCGGDSDSGASADEPLSKTEFVKQANVICEKTSGKIAAEATAIATKESQDPKSQTATIGGRIVTGALVPNLQAELDEIRDLGIPADGKAQVEAFFKATEKVIGKAEVKPIAFSESTSPYTPAEEAAAQYGLTECPISPVTTN